MEDMSQSGKKMRLLTISLMISGALNIGLVATGLFTKAQEVDPKIAIRPVNLEGKNLETGIERCLSQMEKLSFHELVSFLTNRETVDEGYSKRDLSLASLVAFHHFHLEKALSFKPSQRREITIGEKKIELFPGLAEDQYEGIIRFAYEEKWPLTGAGLYKLLKKWPDTKDETLVQAFIVTPEFHALQVLFQKSESPQLVSSLIQLITEGPWEVLDQFTRQQAQLFDLSPERRRTLLLSYMAIGSKTAAKILLESDFAFISKRLEDKGIIGMLSLLTEKTPEAERLCLELLRSPRSDLVWTSAANNLYLYAGEVPPQPIDQKEAISRFAANVNTNRGATAPSEYPADKANTTNPSQKGIPSTQRGGPVQKSTAPTQDPVSLPRDNSKGSPLPPKTTPKQKNSEIIPLQREQTPRIPEKTPKGPAQSHETSISIKHVVKDGESLWKISRQYNVKVDDILRVNQMEKDRLYPGMILIIP